MLICLSGFHETNKNKPQAKTNKKPQNKTKEGHLLLFYRLSVKPALCPRLSGKADLHWTNDTYRNGIFTLFNLSPLHTLSSFSQFILSCAVFSLSHPCFPPASFPFSPEGFLYFFLSCPPLPHVLRGPWLEKTLRQWITFAEGCSLLWR